MKSRYVTPGDLLSLSANESTIIDILRKEKVSTPVALARYCHIPRPTIYITLEKLERRGLVQKRTAEGKKVWRVSDVHTVNETLERSRTALLGNKANTHKLNLNTSTDIVVHKGQETILQVFKNLIHKHGGNRLVGIQGDYAGDSWKGLFTLEEINEINSEIKKEGMITEIITSKGWFKRQVDIFGKSWAENFIGRTAQVHFIDTQYLNYCSQIFLFENQLFLVSMKDEVFIEVKNKEIAKLIISLMRFIENHSLSVNINKILSEILETTSE